MNIHVAAPEVQTNASQTLLRGLDIIEAVGDGAVKLSELVDRVGLTKATTHRLASALVARDYLSFTPRRGYSPGPRLLKLGFQAQQSSSVIQLALPAMDRLAQATLDAVNLGILDAGMVLYLRQSPSRRMVVLRHEPGIRNPVRETALGKALVFPRGPAEWRNFFDPREKAAYAAWEAEMAKAIEDGFATHVETDGERVRCIAAPIYDASGRPVAALSLSTLPQYVEDADLPSLGPAMIKAAAEASRALGRL